MTFFWYKGRFGWRFVALVALVAVAIFVFDLLWRVSDVSGVHIAGGLALVLSVGATVIWLAGRKQRG